MSKLFTTLMALLIAGAAGFAGYVYYTGAASPETAAVGEPDGPSGCALCEMAKKKRSCCEGEASVRRLAFGGSTSAGGCCSTDEVIAVASAPVAVPATAAVLGGAAFANACKASGGCCDMGVDAADNGLTGLAGAAVTLAKK